MYTISSFFSLFSIGGQVLIQPHALRFHLYLGFVLTCFGSIFLRKKEKIRLLGSIILSQVFLWAGILIPFFIKVFSGTSIVIPFLQSPRGIFQRTSGSDVPAIETLLPFCLLSISIMVVCFFSSFLYPRQFFISHKTLIIFSLLTLISLISGFGVLAIMYD